jgi:hypothetical protein
LRFGTASLAFWCGESCVSVRRVAHLDTADAS